MAGAPAGGGGLLAALIPAVIGASGQLEPSDGMRGFLRTRTGASRLVGNHPRNRALAACFKPGWRGSRWEAPELYP